jgi:hypothetical protein
LFDSAFRWRRTEKRKIIPATETAGESPSAGLVGRKGNAMTMKDVALKYPTWQEPYRAAVTETNPTLLRQKIAEAEGAAMLRLMQLENSADNHPEVIAL